MNTCLQTLNSFRSFKEKLLKIKNNIPNPSISEKFYNLYEYKCQSSKIVKKNLIKEFKDNLQKT